MKIGVFSTMYPTNKCPNNGIFIIEELKHLSKHIPVKLIAPLNIVHWFGEDHYYTSHDGYPVWRPFIVAVPWGILQRFYPDSMAMTIKMTGKNFFLDCDIVHAHMAFPDCIASIKVFGKRLPVIVTVHGWDMQYFAMKSYLKPDIIKALNLSKRVICVSNSLMESIKEIGVTTDAVVIPNGIDTSLFIPGDKDNACRSLDLDPQRPRILFIGNFVVEKGIEYLIRAMPVVQEKYPESELILLGARVGSKDITQYDEIISKADVKQAVKIVGSVPHEHIPTWIHASDLLVLPSIIEGFGLVAAEALVCGRPVVTTLSGGPEDIVEDGMGVLVPTRDASALAQGIIQVLNGDGILSSESISELARSRFSYDIVTSKILDIYHDVLSHLHVM